MVGCRQITQVELSHTGFEKATLGSVRTEIYCTVRRSTVLVRDNALPPFLLLGALIEHGSEPLHEVLCSHFVSLFQFISTQHQLFEFDVLLSRSLYRRILGSMGKRIRKIF